MNEWAFAGEVKSWWDDEFRQNPAWGLVRCEVERQTEGSSRRSDLVVHGDNERVVVAGELRLPDHPQPHPYHPDNLAGAIDKATNHGARWAFTSDANTILLIDVARAGRPLERVVHRLELFQIDRREQLDDGGFLSRVEESWRRAVAELAPILRGDVEPPGMSPDELFIEALRALLASPVSAIRQGLDEQRQAEPPFEESLIEWMVNGQHWVHDPSQWQAQLQRTAQLAAYVFTTRLMFHEALRRSHPELDRVEIPENMRSVRRAKSLFQGAFEDARVTSNDYQTLFDWDTIDDYALIADGVVSGWRRVLEHLALFDLSTIGYDVVGKIFERLIDPAERYRLGQHYTRPEVVDLMLSFAIPDGLGPVMDPAVGGGTFLVRAYERIRTLHPELTHQELLAQLFGVDISAFPATLAAINLAAKRLEFEDNYPRIVAKSFFEIAPRSTFMAVPTSIDLGNREQQPVPIEEVRAIVCNPPYVRRQQLAEDQLREAVRSLHRTTGRAIPPTEIGGLSNYHLYFWFHAGQFLSDDGTLAFITAGEWMDSDYGAALQLWLLENFQVEIVIESLAEPWFSEARVGTVVTIARLCRDLEERVENRVRFITLRVPLRRLYGSQPETTRDYFTRVDRLRDRMMALGEGHGESDDLDWSVVRQGDLLTLGAAP